MRSKASTSTLTTSTSSPDNNAVKTVIATGVAQGAVLSSVDIRCAYLNAKNKKFPVYYRLPVGLRKYDPDTGEEIVAYSESAVYGRRQSGRLFEQHVEGIIESIGFSKMECMACTYVLDIKDSNHPYFLLYGEVGKIIIVRQTDDFMIVSYNSEDLRQRTVNMFRQNHEITTTEPGQAFMFNGLEIQQNLNTGDVSIIQQNKIDTLHSNLGLSGQSSRVRTPRSKRPLGPPEPPPPGGALTEDQKLLATINGAITHIARTARPDIAEAASALAPLARGPTPEHLQAAYQVVEYLKQTHDRGIVFNGPRPGQDQLRPTVFTDANYEKGIAKIGVLVMLNGGVIHSSSKIVRRPTCSVTEAEMVGINKGVRFATNLSFILRDLNLDDHAKQIEVFSDSKTAVATGNTNTTRTTFGHYLDIVRYTQHQRQEGVVQLKYVKAQDQLADCLTKPLSGPQFESAIHKFMHTP